MFPSRSAAAAVRQRAAPDFCGELLAKYDAERSFSLRRYLHCAQLKSARDTERERARILALAIDILVDDGAEPIAELEARNVIEAVRAYYDISLIDLRSPRKTKRVLWARQSAIYLARELTGATFRQIGVQLGDRDPTTIDHNWRVVSKRLADGIEPLCTEITELRGILKRAEG